MHPVRRGSVDVSAGAGAGADVGVNVGVGDFRSGGNEEKRELVFCRRASGGTCCLALV